MSWLPWPVLPKKRWPAVSFKKKRAITWDEHCRIVEHEVNPERKTFYQLAWHTGASQTDLALLEASNIDWERHALSFTRKKTKTIAILRFDDAIAEVLRSLPAEPRHRQCGLRPVSSPGKPRPGPAVAYPLHHVQRDA
jgi:integrase